MTPPSNSSRSNGQPTQSTPPLVGRNLRFGYEPDEPIINGVTFDLSPRQLCALVGPNAAGKSTLLRLMTGQLAPWSGSVTFNAQDITQTPPALRARHISYVPQRASATFAFTIKQVVAMGRHVLAPNPGAIDRAMTICQLELLADRVYAHLSVGQQQRVLLARAIAQAAGEGRVMLLDEPCSAMDLWHIHHTLDILQSMARSGLAVLVVLHDINLAARYADTVWLMDQGQITASGPWHEVLTPARLEPVYRVQVRTLISPDHDRPVFDIQPQEPSSDTLLLTNE